MIVNEAGVRESAANPSDPSCGESFELLSLVADLDVECRKPIDTWTPDALDRLFGSKTAVDDKSELNSQLEQHLVWVGVPNFLQI